MRVQRGAHDTNGIWQWLAGQGPCLLGLCVLVESTGEGGQSPSVELDNTAFFLCLLGNRMQMSNKHTLGSQLQHGNRLSWQPRFYNATAFYLVILFTSLSLCTSLIVCVHTHEYHTYCVYVCVHTHVYHDACVGFRGQPAGVCALSLGGKSLVGPEDWVQAIRLGSRLLEPSAEPSHWLPLFIYLLIFCHHF